MSSIAARAAAGAAAIARRPGRKITKVLQFGPRNRHVLDALVGGDRRVLNTLIARGRVVKVGDKRGALYALAAGYDAGRG